MKHSYNSAITSNGSLSSRLNGGGAHAITGTKIVSTSQVMIMEEMGEDETLQVIKVNSSEEIPP